MHTGRSSGFDSLALAPPESSHPRKGGGATPGQPYGEEARRALAERVLKQPVTVVVYGRDRYGRIPGVVHLEGVNVNVWLVQSGLAWAYKGGRNDTPAALRERIEAAEKEARRTVRGLWADANPEPPWLFRRREKLGR